MPTATEFVTPNLHVALVHFPIALLLIGTLIELFSFLWRRHGFRSAGRWMILLGALLGIPTALSGVYALNDVARAGLPNYGPPAWRQTAAASPLAAQQWELLEDHAWLQSSAIIVAVLVAVAWIACSNRWRARLHLLFLLALLVSVGLTLSGAWHGGEAVYRYGTGVKLAISPAPVAPPHTIEHPPAPAHEIKPAPAPGRAPATRPTTISSGDVILGTTRAYAADLPASHEHQASSSAQSLNDKINYYAPPLQIHVILAGSAVALALAALGLSIRKITQGPPVTEVNHIAAALGPPSTLLGGDAPDSTAVTPALDTPEPRDVLVPHPTSRFWVLAFVLALFTFAVGVWLLNGDGGNWQPKELWEQVRQNLRQLIHVINGGAIVILPLVMAAIARWAPRNKWLLFIFAILLVLAVALQLWLGILLLYDGMEGPVTRFN